MELLDFAYLSNRDQPALVGLYRDAKKQVVLMRKIVDPYVFPVISCIFRDLVVQSRVEIAHSFPNDAQ